MCSSPFGNSLDPCDVVPYVCCSAVMEDCSTGSTSKKRFNLIPGCCLLVAEMCVVCHVMW